MYIHRKHDLVVVFLAGRWLVSCKVAGCKTGWLGYQAGLLQVNELAGFVGWLQVAGIYQ
jgi:hypothetical protein